MLLKREQIRLVMSDLGTLHVEMFPEELIALNEEIIHHPILLARLKAQTDPDIYIRINEIATHCGLILDGMYTRDDILELCVLLKDKLYKSRSTIIH
jgi:hypothetical protein